MMELMPLNCWSNMRAIESKRGLRTDPFNNSLGWICCELAPLAMLAFKRSNSTLTSVCLGVKEIYTKSIKINEREESLTLHAGIATTSWLPLRGSSTGARWAFRAWSTWRRRVELERHSESRPRRSREQKPRWCRWSKYPTKGRWRWKLQGLHALGVMHIRQSDD